MSEFGADHVLLGTDYPFDMGTTDPLGFLARVGLGADEQRLVLGGNAGHRSLAGTLVTGGGHDVGEAWSTWSG